jgi:hypothetical protein
MRGVYDEIRRKLGGKKQICGKAIKKNKQNKKLVKSNKYEAVNFNNCK